MCLTRPGDSDEDLVFWQSERQLVGQLARCPAKDRPSQTVPAAAEPDTHTHTLYIYIEQAEREREREREREKGLTSGGRERELPDRATVGV